MPTCKTTQSRLVNIYWLSGPHLPPSTPFSAWQSRDLKNVELVISSCLKLIRVSRLLVDAEQLQGVLPQPDI